MSDEEPTSTESPPVDTPESIRQRLTRPGGVFEVAYENVRGQRLPVFANRLRSLRAMLERSREFCDQLHVVDGDVRLTYGQQLDLVERLAHVFHERHDVGQGDRVAIFAANRWEWLVSFWASAWLGAVPVAMNGLWTKEEFADAFALVEPKLLVGDGPRLARVRSCLGRHPVIDLDTDFEALTRAPALAATPTPEIDEDEPALLIFTSGTTGRAKAVTVSHRAVCGFPQVNLFSEAYGKALFGLPLPATPFPSEPADDIVLVTSPLFHVSMLYGAVTMALAKGTRLVLLRGRFDPDRTLRAIERERVTLWMALGSAAPRVAACPTLGDYDLSSLRQLGIGGAPVSPAVQASLRSAFPVASRTLGMGYTSTEAGAVIASIGGPEFEQHPTSTGRITITTQVELRDAEGKPVPDGCEGEVHVRSPYTALGYWNDPEATAALSKPDGWLAMGDIARFEDGLLYINSRARDMLLVSAENVSPTEIEYRLEAHPRVLEAAVIGLDDPITGDAVCAVVVVDPDDDLSADELESWCRQSLAPYKVPTIWHFTPDALPRTPSGKIIKSAVRAGLASRTT